MKVVTSQQMSDIESQAYRDGASESDFMEEAGSGVGLVVHDFAEKYDLNPHIYLLCGKGNNSGDAYVAGIHLLQLDYNVTAFQIEPISECSPLCKQNCSRFAQDGGDVQEVTDPRKIHFNLGGIIIDGLFGTGFQGVARDPYATLIRKANDSKLPIVAVDIPSGLNGETGETDGETIVATATVFLGLPKIGFFLRKGWDYVGKLHYVDFGLGKQYIENCKSELTMLSPDMLKPKMPLIKQSRHKYEAGYVVGLAGSPGMSGAAILSSLAALRGGAGIIRLYHPDGMQAELASSPYELIKMPYHQEDAEIIAAEMNRASAAFIGPGIARHESTLTLLCELFPKLEKPCVIDADALTLIAEAEIPLPKQAVLTPHHGEFARLQKKSSAEPITMSFLKKCQKYVEKEGVTLVLKGGPTFIFHPGEQITVNPSGDPGMATAGSGDVLTGLIAAFIAQGLSTHDAALVAVYLHGVAGEFAADDLTSSCMIASDIIEYFPNAFDSLQ